MKKNTVAVNIITKDNEPYLKNTLDCSKKISDEIVIVFTGEKNSEEYKLCKQYCPDTTYYFKWNNNFSKARNFAIDKTKSKWIIWLDSDEFIDDESIENIKKLINNKINNMYHQFKLVHGSTTMGQIRMFLKHDDIRWQNPIHERIIPKNFPDKHSGIKIIHKVNNINDSSVRNINILNKELEINQNNHEYHFYLAIEYHLINQQMKSLFHAEKFLYLYNNTSIDTKKIYIRYLIAWINAYDLKNYQKSVEILLAQLIINCNISEFWCLLGDIYFKMGRIKNAYQFYKNALTMGEYKYDNMWITDLDKYNKYPNLMLKICEDNLNIDLYKFRKEINEPILP